MTSDNPRRTYTVAEMFCGCGGFSHGFSRSGRFNVVFGNDIKKAALRTFQFNHAGGQGVPEIIEDDIRKVSIDTVLSALANRGVGEGDLDCLIGGPPCQGFSQMRRSEERQGSAIVKFKGYNRLDQDHRNDLVLRFLEVANRLRPKFIVIENVPQMKWHTHNGVRGGLVESVETLLREMGYGVQHGVLNAANYGVPQLRERLFFIASRVCEVSFPRPTHADPESDESKSLERLAWVTVSDAIRDLPPPAQGPKDDLGGRSLDLYPDVSLSDFAKSMRSSKCFPFNHLTRRYSQKIINIIKEMRPGETWDYASERMRKQYEPLIAQSTEPGEDETAVIERLEKQGALNPTFYRRYYWSAYTRLSWNRPALTITANANFLGSGRFTHPEKDRGITMREAARLQSFDDDFKLNTSAEDDSDTANIGIGLDMIGEAVPPMLSEAIARHIASLLDHQAKQGDRAVETEPACQYELDYADSPA